MPDALAPDAAELAAFIAGHLPVGRRAQIDGWLANLPEAEADALLAGIGAPLPLSVTARLEAGWSAELPRGRLDLGEPLGEGGMAQVFRATDRVLGRTVALKVLRARRAEETLEGFLTRQAAFRREAALTAGLDHPGIPAVLDVGTWDGRPCFTLEVLHGRTLSAALAAGVVSAQLLPAVLRVAEALAHAHGRGLVHRDLTPANVLLGEHGAVHVMDWGLAATIGSAAAERAGTPGWMAPEQERGGAADPRQDVWALGGLLAAIFGGQALPRALAAVVRRCRMDEPAARYADAGAVAADLVRWFNDGLTLAQEATAIEVAWLRLRRSPAARTTVVITALAVLVLSGLFWWQRHQVQVDARLHLAALAGSTALDRSEALRPALTAVRDLRRDLPDLPEAAALEARLTAALELADHQARLTARRARLAELLARTRRFGPWADPDQDWATVLTQAIGNDPQRLRQDAEAPVLAEALAFRWRSAAEAGTKTAATAAAAVLAEGGPTPGWQALGRLLGRTEFSAHDAVFCACPDSDLVLGEPSPAAVALALYGPEPRLTAWALQRLDHAPGDFWPLLAAGRAALASGDLAQAEAHARTALGAEPTSLLPTLLLAYVALARQDTSTLVYTTARAQRIDDNNAEALALRAVALARSGDLLAAQILMDRIPAGHLRYHLATRVGHPMEATVDALVAAGLVIPVAEPALGPLRCH